MNPPSEQVPLVEIDLPAQHVEPGGSAERAEPAGPGGRATTAGSAGRTAGPVGRTAGSAGRTAGSAGRTTGEPGLAGGTGGRQGSVGDPAELRPGEPPADPARQLSLFGVEAAEPSPDDLAGLLAGPGQVGRMGGTARVSVVVDAGWRVHVLVAELALRGLTASWVATADEHHLVRTQYAVTLAELGRTWLRGASQRPPEGFHLNGGRLRLWTAAAGHPDPSGYVLRLGADEASWAPVGQALAAVGLAAELLVPADDGPGYRITGRRRLIRLAELVGDRPHAAPPACWPLCDG